MNIIKLVETLQADLFMTMMLYNLVIVTYVHAMQFSAIQAICS